MRKIIKAVHVHAIRASSRTGVLSIGHMAVPCALGRSGISFQKREGDGATPAGRWNFGTLFWRPDRRRRPLTALPARPLRPGMGWCDQPDDRNYNRPVPAPYPESHEEMWRDDRLYDVVVTLSHNRLPRVRGHGSAVFFHLASGSFEPTAGCVAVRARDAARILHYLGPKTVIVAGAVTPRASRGDRR
jgi:L,D-peptidoglycan transpeptidase YkuD (ErfK/YbiS/YcfS/YnhG family)